MSQYVSGGGYMQASSPYSQGSPGGAKYQSEASKSMRPMTILQVNRASQAHTDAEWKLDDQDVAQISVVAQARKIRQQATITNLDLDDGTGEIEVRTWMSKLDEDQDDDSVWNGIVENDYVRVSGQIKTFGDKKYLNATHIVKCTDPYEIYFHTLDAIYVTRIMEKGPPLGTASGQSGASPAILAPGTSSAYQAGSSKIAGDQYAHLSVFEKAIMKYLLESSSSYGDDGTPMMAIVEHVQTVGETPMSLGNTMDVLLDQGLVYTTVDDSHFSVSQ